MKSQLNNFEFAFISEYVTQEGVIIPLRVHIKDIEYEFSETESNIQYFEEFKDNELIIEDERKDYTYALRIQKDNRAMQEILKYIDDTLLLFEDHSNTFLPSTELKDKKDIFQFIGQDDFKNLLAKIMQLKHKCIVEFNKRANKELKLDIKPPKIQVKGDPDMTKEYKEFMHYTELYILLQLLIEYNTPVFFYENIGKSVMEWSYREIHLKLLFLTSKNRFDGFLNDFQSWKMDKIKSDGK